MGAVRFRSLLDFARRAPRIVEEDIRDLGVEMHVQAQAFALEKAIAETPRGPARLDAQVRKGEPYSQHMKDRWFLRIKGRKIRASGLSLQQLRALIRRPGSSSAANDAPHARVIDKGISIARGPKRSGHRIGSTQAPRGISWPVMNAFTARADRLRAAAIKHVERKARR